MTDKQQQNSADGRPVDSAGNEVACPWCQSTDVSVRSPYGGSAVEILMQCNSCKTPFGWMKWYAKAKSETPD